MLSKYQEAQIREMELEWKETMFSDEILNKSVIKGQMICFPISLQEKMDEEIADWWIEKINSLLSQRNTELIEKIQKGKQMYQKGLDYAELVCDFNDGIDEAIRIIKSVIKL